MDSKDKRYRTVDAETPVQGRVLLTDIYWLCKDGDPKQAIYFNDSVQGNRHKGIADRMLNYTAKKTGWTVQIVFMPFAYRLNTSWRQ